MLTLSLPSQRLTAADPQLAAPFRVCLDPGHPSENNDGRELLNGVREVEVNWAVAQALRRLLEAKGFTVVLTKNSLGEHVTNKRRAEIANEAGADLMLRLHADSEGPSGLTVFHPRRQGQSKGGERTIAGSDRGLRTRRESFPSRAGCRAPRTVARQRHQRR